jgi:hypothetical protein
MTVKEIAESVGKTERSVRNWISKVVKLAENSSARNAVLTEEFSVRNNEFDRKMQLRNSIKEKAEHSSPENPADYTFEETMLIIEVGMGPEEAGVYRASAGSGDKPDNPEIGLINAKSRFIEALVDAFKSGGITRAQFQAMTGAPNSEPDSGYYTPPRPLLIDRSPEHRDAIDKDILEFAKNHIHITSNEQDFAKRQEVYEQWGLLETKPIGARAFGERFCQLFPQVECIQRKVRGANAYVLTYCQLY